MMVEETKLAAPSQDECTLALLAHVLQLITWWTGPPVIYLVKRESGFVSFHALQALIYQGFVLAANMLMVALWLALIISEVLLGGASGRASRAAPTTFIAGFGLCWLSAWALALVLAIVYGIKANRGEWAAYPIIGRWARRLAGINKGNQPVGLANS
jgi:hypothetical protein